MWEHSYNVDEDATTKEMPEAGLQTSSFQLKAFSQKSYSTMNKSLGFKKFATEISNQVIANYTFKVRLPQL